MDPVFFDSAADLRAWFEANGERATELEIGFYKLASGKSGITYKEAVDEALCFGWIDGVRRRIDDDSYMNRFTPRRKGSNWSAVNIKRVGELSELGRMRPAGLAAFALRDEAKTRQYSYENQDREFAESYEAEFRAHGAAWEYFQAQTPSYRRRAITWVTGAKREETRRKRLELLVADSAAGRRMATLLGSVRKDKAGATAD